MQDIMRHLKSKKVKEALILRNIIKKNIREFMSKEGFMAYYCFLFETKTFLRILLFNSATHCMSVFMDQREKNGVERFVNEN